MPRSPALRVVFWGTGDLGKPRNRILIQGLRAHGVEVIECHTQVWRGVEDKSRVRGARARMRLFWRWLSAYPGLLWRYLKLPAHDLVLVGYLGQLDVLLIGIFGTSAKAAQVIPNKVYQVLAAGRALITSDTPAARELLAPGPGIILVPPGDPQALATAIRKMRGRCPAAAAAHLATLRRQVTPTAVTRELAERLRRAPTTTRALARP
jgi:glycosyltransferase involved in cell wall biosynthesis